MKYKYILEVIKSKPNRWGNTFCAFILTSTETGNCVKGRNFNSGSSSNILGAIRHLNDGQHLGNCYHTCDIIMGIQEFNWCVKTWAQVDENSANIAHIMAKVNDTTQRDRWVNML